MFLSMNHKLAYTLDWLCAAEWFIIYTLSALILVDLFVATFFVYVMLCAGFMKYQRRHDPWSQKTCILILLIIGVIIALSFHGLFFYMAIFTDDYPYLSYMLKTLCYEVIALVCGAIIAAVFFCVRFCFRGIITIVYITGD